MRVAVVGGGLVGVATAHHLALHYASQIRHLALYEKSDKIASEQSGRNSGVIHAGIGYSPGSLKARLCVQGAQCLYEFCSSEAGRGVPIRRAGKYIVARNEIEAQRLAGIMADAMANGVQGLELIDDTPLPSVRARRSLYSPNTGVIDYPALARALVEDTRTRLGSRFTLYLSSAVSLPALEPDSQTHPQWAQAAEVWHANWDWVFVCVGGSTRPTPNMRILPVKGQYFELTTDAIQRLGLGGCNIYPVPDRRYPFAGVHFTPSVDGKRVWVGPTATLAGWPPLQYSGFWRLARCHWRFVLEQMLQEYAPSVLLCSLREMVPALQPADLRRSFCGIRAQALTQNGVLLNDFHFERNRNIIHVRNAPSPAATSCMAIAEYLVKRFIPDHGSGSSS
jgi:L-2-hydroxyglutarate oxidase